MSSHYGLSFSITTTAANDVVAPIHERMPAILEEVQISAYFAGEIVILASRKKNLEVEDAVNPLVKPKGPPAQMEFF